MQQLIPGLQVNQLQLIFEKPYYLPPVDLQKRLDTAWDNFVEQCHQNQVQIWNGTVLGVKSFSPTQLVLRPVEYKHAYLSNKFITEFSEHSFEDRPNGIFVATFIKTADDQFIISESSGKTASESSLGILGGTVNTDEQKINSVSDMELNLIRELDEELGPVWRLASYQITPLGLFYNSNLKAPFLYLTQISLTADALIKSATLNFEHKKLIAVPLSNFLRFVETNNSHMSNSLVEGSKWLGL